MHPHIRVMRRVYARKREALTSCVAARPQRCRLVGLEAGFHVFLELPPEVSASQVARLCAARGVLAETVDQAYLYGLTRNGLLLGYGTLSVADIVSGMETILDVMGRLG